ncbi:MAG: tetraacyldisaccharide 4'-kinase [Planctomycetota bacterium]|jgi:tetraacyldisaccharide 4'-kinase|nr:tetraacyldisaccharide 4'-kinase [Planctomycetota bacterium]MDA1201407.1 tetraacyldisaccharide 4'-kinase [Planctomycetota bacterium]
MSLLPDAETFRRLADGSLRGVGPALLRTLLAGLAAPYGLATTARNAAYDRGLLASFPAPVPVVSIGNLTLGGTGKTPLVAWVVRHLLARGRHPAVVSRGYAAADGLSDEAAELAILLPGTLHVANRDRVAGAAVAADRGADVVVLDDGFQHRRLRRNLDVVAIDATDPFGCDHLFPRGLLRESVAGLRRADAVVLTRASSISADRRRDLRTAVERARGGPLRAWVECDHHPVGLRTANGCSEPIATLAGRRIAAFCGIGNPAAFRATLIDAGCDVVGFRGFADHHAYNAHDLADLAAWARNAGAEHAVTTLKDLVKIRKPVLGDLPLAAVEIAIEPLGDASSLLGLITGLVAPGEVAP